jgi:response regulator RpfG family c-di-GMP phosphodiesterase
MDSSSCREPDSQNRWTLLCVDDEPGVLSALRRVFRRDGYNVLLASSGAEGLQILQRESVDLVISDMRMPVMDGAEFLKQVRVGHPETARILLTGYASRQATESAIHEGEIYRCLDKPWNDDDLLSVVRQALESRSGNKCVSCDRRHRNAMHYDRQHVQIDRPTHPSKAVYWRAIN